MSAPLPHDPVNEGREIIAACRALGFALAGIAPAQPTSRPDALRDWLAAGKHGEMSWMAELLDERLDPRVMLPGARSILMVADVYAANEPVPPLPGMARIARYAQGRDYHVVIKRRLHRLADILRRRHAGHEFRSFVDSGPVLERDHAARAGLGWIGKHTLLIHPRLGSYLLLGGMVTTLELEPPRESPGSVADHCGSCTRCIDACPTGAITPYSVDARRCISYLTIEHAGPIDEGLASRTGAWAFGCDVCQEVCPYNRELDAGMVAVPYRARREALVIDDVLAWGSAEHEAFVSGSALKRATLGMLQRNVRLAAGHAPDPASTATLAWKNTRREGPETPETQKTE